jgi:predicted dehydrogenase
MGKTMSVLLVAIGGYGGLYANAMLDEGEKHNAKIVGVVDPSPQGYKRYDEIVEAGIPIYKTMEEFYRSNKADLAVISSPIHFHSSQACMALSKGSHVLCEKPISATPDEAIKMMEMQKATGLLAGVGYQWSFSEAIRALKKDIQQGILGKPVLLKSIVLWPRNKKYFSRGWAGKIKDEQGNMILDSVANNATAHYLHNMFYVLGQSEDSSAVPYKVEAELYRANDIENFDTTAVRITTKCGAELRFYATHAVNQKVDPVFRYEFENAVVYFDSSDEKGIYAQFNDGSVKEYGDPFSNNQDKLWVMMDAIRGNGAVPCTFETAFSHTLCIDAMHKSVPVIPDFPANVRRYDEEKEVLWIDGLFELMNSSYEQGILLSEAGADWAVKGKTIEVSSI